MGRMQRNKGAAGEREVLKMLGERLGMKLERNLSQTRNGGADCVELGNIRLEVKRQERLNVNAWWVQAAQQAGYVYIPLGMYTYKVDDLNKPNTPEVSQSLIPALAYRQSHKPWTFMLDSFDLKLLPYRGHLLGMNVDTFCTLLTACGLLSSEARRAPQ